ncbi:glycosyltransferase [Paraflavitalea speifideaquila]|uniref:glycosyltransferase n=1 Tax=Paraflavitalea speifideaquila TaxID=3076558 RepID=UPI0028E6B2F1|nr:glycosyltransferase [Paraflavitalea speifideiaquila]
MADLRQFEPTKPALLVNHPLYDSFGDAVPKTTARQHLGLSQDDKILLFFGFIRKYKGLDILFEAMKIIKDRRQNTAAGSRNSETKQPVSNIKLLVAGEFYEDKAAYDEQIRQLGIEDLLILRTDFIADSEVKYYMCAADCVVQPYRNATQSGVTPLAYHYEKPVIVTNVGGLADLVPHEEVGLVTEPDPVALANAIERYFELGKTIFYLTCYGKKKNTPGIPWRKQSWTYQPQNLTPSINFACTSMYGLI